MKEETVLFGRGQGLVGTLSVPSRRTGSVGIILLNAGMIHRIGPHRVNVRLARELARHGIASIRFDLAGHGDSARPSGLLSFRDQAVEDIQQAADALANATALQRFAVFGICSGAYHAFNAALKDERLTALMLFDAFRYPTWKTRLIYYLTRLRQPQRLRRAARLCARTLRRTVHSQEPPAAARTPAAELERLGVIDVFPAKEEVGSGLRTLLDRGVRIFVINSGSTMHEYNYTRQFEETFSEYGVAGRVRVGFKPDLDHQFTGNSEQQAFIAELVEWATASGLAPSS
jgi:pimeloyl-ACP methyl ester carboxylesterase